MRIFPLALCAACCFYPLGSAVAKPQRNAKNPPRKSIPTSRPIPLSPAQLRGKVVYILGRDVWATEPQSRRKFLLYKDLFFPANKSPNAYSDTYGGGLSFGRSDIAWSADLTHVAFIYRDPRYQGSELFVMRWDGKEKRQLSDGKYKHVLSVPRWSPDGQSIMFMLSGPYRMGGPGYGYRSVVITRLDGKPMGINTRDENDQPVSGTFFNPYWSRDGTKVLLDYSPQDADYIETVTRKVASLDKTPLADFKDNWSDFLVENQSSNGMWRLRYTQGRSSAFWDLFRVGTIESQGIPWGDSDGFHATRFCISDDGKQLIAQSELRGWTINAQGNTTSTYVSGLWSAPIIKNGAFNPRLLVKDAQLIDWY